jgi:hypothetical protein
MIAGSEKILGFGTARRYGEKCRLVLVEGSRSKYEGDCSSTEDAVG